MRDVAGIFLRFGTSFAVLLVIGLIWVPNMAYAAGLAAFLGVLLWAQDRVVPFRIQGWTRWAVDGAVAFTVIYVAELFWAGLGLNWIGATLAAGVIAAVELPVHQLLISRFGVRKRQDDRDGIR